MAGTAICSVVDSGRKCDQTVHGNGYCEKHLRRQRKFGTTGPSVGTWGRTIQERVWAKVDKSGPNDCWLWTGGKGGTEKHSYGIFREAAGAKTNLVHRLTYTWANGEIPAEREIDHICHQTLCVNPAHLRLTTKKQNKENRKGAHGKSGIRGVRQESKNRWSARVVHNRKHYYLGLFATPEEAGEAARLKRLEFFTHSDGR